MSCFGDAPSLTVGAPKERVVSWVLVVSGGSPSLTVEAQKERVVSGVLVVSCDSPLPHGRGSKRACRVLGAVKSKVMDMGVSA